MNNFYEFSKFARRNKHARRHRRNGAKSKRTLTTHQKLMVEVWKDTHRQCMQLQRHRHNSELIDITDDPHPPCPPCSDWSLPQVEVLDCDTLDLAAQYVIEPHSDVLVLNMASEFKPGGGVRSGKTAQEECIFRRTDAVLGHPTEWYPLQSNQAVYVPSVQVFKDSCYNILQHPFDISLITMPALRKPRLFFGEYTDSDYTVMEQKINGIFKVAITHGHTHLVLGALGCGVFGNPPYQVAEIFKKCIEKYGQHFVKIGFAVLVIKSKDQQNFDIFKRVICG